MQIILQLIQFFTLVTLANRRVARIFLRGGVTLCQSEGIHQTVTMAKVSSWHLRHLL